VAVPSTSGLDGGMTQAPAEIVEQERRLRRDLGFPGLTAIGFSNIVGSGWLFAAMYAAQIAGPAALLSWIGAGVLCALIALVMIELGATRPEGGGTVRWPLYASGRLVGTVIGWSVLLSVGGTAGLKDIAKRYLNARPNLRIFQNTRQQDIMKFNDDVPSVILPMGALPALLLGAKLKAAGLNQQIFRGGQVYPELSGTPGTILARREKPTSVDPGPTFCVPVMVRGAPD